MLKAVSEGRAMVSGSCGMPLTIDGFGCADQFVGSRLASAGLISGASQVPAAARIIDTGRAVLQPRDGSVATVQRMQSSIWIVKHGYRCVLGGKPSIAEVAAVTVGGQ